MVVYLDLVMLLNFLIDGLLLLAANRLTGHPPGWKRAAWAAAAGSAYAGLCLLPQTRWLGGPVYRLLCLGVMAVIAFGWDWSTIRRGAVFLLLSMALGGLAQGLDQRGFFALVLSAGALAALCHFGLNHPVGTRQYQPVELSWGGKCLRLTALVDTGNTLRDPITGATVIVAGADVAQKLGIPGRFVTDPVEALSTGRLPGARLIPYRTVGCAGGMLLGVRCQRILLNGQQVSPLVAFAPECIGKPEAYQVLAGGV